MLPLAYPGDNGLDYGRSLLLAADLVVAMVRVAGDDLFFCFATILAGVFRPFEVLIPIEVLAICGSPGRLRPSSRAMGATGGAGLAVSAISSPNNAATSLSSSTRAAAGAAVVSDKSRPALASNSFSSTPRSTNRSRGCSSSLAPTP